MIRPEGAVLFRLEVSDTDYLRQQRIGTISSSFLRQRLGVKSNFVLKVVGNEILSLKELIFRRCGSGQFQDKMPCLFHKVELVCNVVH